jgi:hypothetical protein
MQYSTLLQSQQVVAFNTMINVLFLFFILVLLQTSSESKLRGDDNGQEVDRGLLLDPKSVVQKTAHQLSKEGEWKYPLNPATLQRPLTILAFGASNTWGARLEDRYTQAYPWMLGEPNFDYVDNLAVRATGADYPSLCLESLIPDPENKNYDLILLEFNMGGSNGFPLLLKRVQDRYPDAIIILVHLWAIITFAIEKESGLGPTQIGKNPDLNWVWIDGEETFNKSDKINCGFEICLGEVMEQLVKDAGGYVYKFPLPQTPKIAIENGWFDGDWHHLSHRGHWLVADGILNILSQHQTDLFKPKRLGTFGLGDQCFSWFMNGNVEPNYYGAELKLLEGSVVNLNQKYSLEVNPLTGTALSFESKFPIPVPMGLSYMTQEGANYAIVEVFAMGCVDVETKYKNTPVVIDPNNNFFRSPTVHASVYFQIGWAYPGKNLIEIKTIEQREKPFRITGVFACGVCSETGNLGSLALELEENHI